MARRIRRLRGWWLAVAAVALGTGCGTLLQLELPGVDAGGLLGPAGAGAGGGSGAAADGGTGDGGLAPAALCEQLLGARCGALARCGLLSDAGVDTCRVTLGHTWCGPLTWPSHLAVHALRLDLAQAQRCAAALSASSCAAVLSLPAECATFLVPAAMLGQSCYDGYPECAQGVCRGLTCPKSCQLPGAPGEPCVLPAECQAGLTCRFAQPGATGQCGSPGGADAGCDDASACAAPLACVQGHCLELPPAGQGCLLGQCAAAAWCAADGGGCLPRLDAGAPCQDGAACGRGLLCLQGACAPAAVASGADCLPPQGCLAPGEACVGPADGGRCQAPLDGGPCARDEECLAPLACQDAEDGGRRCERRLPAGAACGTTRQCQLDADCLAGSCQPRPRPGEACGAASCLEGLCRPGLAADGGALCGPLLGPRLGCTADAHCASGRCALGSCLTACTP